MSDILSSSGFRRGGIGLGISESLARDCARLEQVLLLASHELELEVPLEVFRAEVPGADPAFFVGDETVPPEAILLPD